MPVARVAVMLALAVALAACDRQRVKVTVDLEADGSLVRTVRLWTDDTMVLGVVRPPAEAAIARARTVYGDSVPAAERTPAVTFRGTFRSVPPDLGPAEDSNRGGYEVACRCRAGWCGLYRERRPGRTDYSARYEAVEKAVDLAAKVQVALAAEHLAGEPGLAKLVAHLEGPWRRDARDLMLLLLFPARAEDGFLPEPDAPVFTSSMSGSVSMALELLDERGYPPVSELAGLFDSPESGRGVDLALSYVARMMGREADDALRAKLTFLARDETVEAALNEAIGRLGLTRADFDAAIKPLGEALLLIDYHGDPILEVELRLPPEAGLVETTGQVGEDGRIQFVDRMGEGPVRRVFYTEFAVPDGAWQKAHFGSTLLEGNGLYKYARWLSSLPAEQASAWEGEVEKLTPGPDLPDRIRAIGSPADGRIDYRDRGVKVLLEALGVKR